MNKQQSYSVAFGPVRIYHHNLVTPSSQGGSAEDKRYTLTMLLPKTDDASKKAIDAAIEAVAQDALHTKWNGSAPVSLMTPIYDGDGPRANGEPFAPVCAGCWVINAKSKEPPEIVEADGRPVSNIDSVYRGMWVYVFISFYSYFRSGKKGIGCGLGPIMKFKDDERLDNRMTAKKAFGAFMKPAVLEEDTPPFDMAPSHEIVPPSWAFNTNS